MKNVLYIVSYIFALLCFMTTNLFDNISVFASSGLKTLGIVNLAAALIILVFTLFGVRLGRLIIIINGMMLVPTILAHSKLNWLELAFQSKFLSKMPVAVTTLAIMASVLCSIIAERLASNEKKLKQWADKGAPKEDLNIIEPAWKMLSFMTIAAMAILLTFTASAGFLVQILLGNQSSQGEQVYQYSSAAAILLIVLGVVTAGGCIWYYTRTLFKNK